MILDWIMLVAGIAWLALYIVAAICSSVVLVIVARDAWVNRNN